MFTRDRCTSVMLTNCLIVDMKSAQVGENRYAPKTFKLR
jgi:hypothetical protein